MKIKNSCYKLTNSSAIKSYYSETLHFPSYLLNQGIIRKEIMKNSKGFPFHNNKYQSKRTQNKGKFGKARKWNSFGRNSLNDWLDD